MQYFRAMLEISIQIHPHPKIPLQKLNTIKQTLNSSPFSSAKSYQTHYFNSAVRAAQMPRVAASVTTSAWGPRLRKLWATKPKPWCENVSVHWAYPQSASEPWQLNIHQLVPSLMMFTFPARKKKTSLESGMFAPPPPSARKHAKPEARRLAVQRLGDMVFLSWAPG